MLTDGQDIWTDICTGTQTHRTLAVRQGQMQIDILTYRQANIPTCRKTDIPTCRNTDMPTWNNIYRLIYGQANKQKYRQVYGHQATHSRAHIEIYRRIDMQTCIQTDRQTDGQATRQQGRPILKYRHKLSSIIFILFSVTGSALIGLKLL